MGVADLLKFFRGSGSVEKEIARRLVVNLRGVEADAPAEELCGDFSDVVK